LGPLERANLNHFNSNDTCIDSGDDAVMVIAIVVLVIMINLMMLMVVLMMLKMNAHGDDIPVNHDCGESD
jgi:hypothetical protein